MRASLAYCKLGLMSIKVRLNVCLLLLLLLNLKCSPRQPSASSIFRRFSRRSELQSSGFRAKRSDST
uniref:Putative secreted protein n=1 Tax=Anopheles darlingi TaxID=43151 RepID=A0A2M4DFD0_ANODA